LSAGNERSIALSSIDARIELRADSRPGAAPQGFPRLIAFILLIGNHPVRSLEVATGGGK
jgi:hypothetical protein